MAKLFVGQPVRFVKERISRGYLGREARIYAIGPGLTDKNGNPCDLYIRFECGFETAVMVWQVEPILPEGHKPCEEAFTKELSDLLSKVVA